MRLSKMLVISLLKEAESARDTLLLKDVDFIDAVSSIMLLCRETWT